MGGLTGIHAAIRFRELMRDLLSFVRISGASPEPGVSARRQTYNLSSRVLETERSGQLLQSRKHHTSIFDPMVCRPMILGLRVDRLQGTGDSGGGQGWLSRKAFGIICV